MTRRAAILGLGARGARFAEAFHRSGWLVSGFDPDPLAGRSLSGLTDWSREQAISSTVKGADWVMCCLPERLELMQMVLQRAQAEAPGQAIIAVASRVHDIEAVQACAMRPAQVFRVVEAKDGGMALDASERNESAAKEEAREGLAELAAVLSLPLGENGDQEDLGAESA